jgi:hypothetical protein
MTISIKPTASGSTIEQDGSTILTVDGSGNITPSNSMYPKVPAFSAYMGSDLSLSSATWTKVPIDTEDFDTTSDFDSTTNYRYTPSVAGYYQINGTIRVVGTGRTSLGMAFYKNGSSLKVMSLNRESSSSSHVMSASHLVYMNGSTDYIELYAYDVFTTSGSLDYGAAKDSCFFSGHLVSV